MRVLQTLVGGLLVAVFVLVATPRADASGIARWIQVGPLDQG